jgi:putative transposase
MRESRFTESRIVGILKQGEAAGPVAEILRQHNISKRPTFTSGPNTPGRRPTS